MSACCKQGCTPLGEVANFSNTLTMLGNIYEQALEDMLLHLVPVRGWCGIRRSKGRSSTSSSLSARELYDLYDMKGILPFLLRAVYQRTDVAREGLPP